ncbi:hypothetical protein NADE_007280 [Nannochloris sp. 'desiccata']|nr:hypothetical protein NADE_007280 [Chlorella desiccata (nom. nud.)]
MGPAPKGQASKVFINLEIGDQIEATKQEQGYKLAQEFLKSVGSQSCTPYDMAGLNSLSNLDNETQEIFTEAFSSDPTWSNQGTARLNPPDALAKGHLEIELDYKSAPKAAENFRCLCTGEKGKGKAERVKLCTTKALICIV